MIKLSELKGYDEVKDDLTPYGHTSLMETCKYMKDLYSLDIHLSYNSNRTGVEVKVFDGMECIDRAYCLFSDLNSAPCSVLPDEEDMLRIKECVNGMDNIDPMDGDETAQLADFFLFILDEKNGNLDKEELEIGYKKWGNK